MERPNEPQRPGPPITRELPLVPPSPSAGGATQVLTPPAPPQPTGPVDFVPGPPPAVAPERPEEAPVVGPRRRARRRAALVAPVLGLAGVVLLEVGLLLAADGGSFWSRVPLWSGFATFAALLALPAVVGRPARRATLTSRPGLLGAGAVAGVALFWLLVVLPVADTDRGFVLTAALGCLGAAFWLAPPRAD